MPSDKLLYVINHVDWFWSHRLPLALSAQKAGWDVHVAVTGAARDAGLSARGFAGHDLPAYRGPLALPKIIATLHRLIRDKKPDLLHAVTLKYAFLTGLAALGFPHLRRVYTIAGLGYLFSGSGLKPRLLRLAIHPLLRLIFNNKNARLIFQNPDDRDIFIKCGYVRPEHCYLIRGSGVDLNFFFPQEGIDSDAAPIVLMPTRLVHDKGVAVFTEAARILKREGVQARFQIAGGLTHENPNAITKKEMEALIADGAAEWLGRVSDMAACYRKSALIAYPSFYREGIPKVLLEAAAMGKAIVTTDHPGCREAVRHGDNGLLVPVRDAAALAEAIKMLLEDPALRHSMERRSRERAEKEFDVALINKQTLAVYDFSVRRA